MFWIYAPRIVAFVTDSQIVWIISCCEEEREPMNPDGFSVDAG